MFGNSFESVVVTEGSSGLWVLVFAAFPKGGLFLISVCLWSAFLLARLRMLASISLSGWVRLKLSWDMVSNMRETMSTNFDVCSSIKAVRSSNDDTQLEIVEGSWLSICM